MENVNLKQWHKKYICCGIQYLQYWNPNKAMRKAYQCCTAILNFGFFVSWDLDALPSCSHQLSITYLFAPHCLWATQQWVRVLSWKWIQHQQSTWKIYSTFQTPQSPRRCEFKVLKGITPLLFLGWIKKTTLFFSATTDMLSFLTWLLFGFERLRVSSLRKSFLSLIVWSQQKNYSENTLCWLTVQRAHKQGHLAIISSQSQIRTAKRMFIKKNGWLWERKKIGQVDRERDGGAYWSPRGVMVYQWREVVENIRNFHHRISCNWVI